MNKTVPVIIALVIVAAGGVYFFTRDGEQPDSNVGTQTQQPAGSNESETTQQTGSDADTQHLAGANMGATVDATGQTEVAVTMTDDLKFDPTVLKIKKGTTITWTNNGDDGHDVMPAGNSPNQFQGSQLLATGESYSFTFDEVGKYYYFCTPHSTEMRAIIEVVE